MNYYDEFGLTPQASAEEIRHAYRNLSRLLHPDQQGDETLRRLAETQMKRLNSIHDLLVDPAERRKYDSRLSGDARNHLVPEIVWAHGGFAVKRLNWADAGRGVWLLAAMIVSLALFWYLWTPRAQTAALPAAPVRVPQPQPPICVSEPSSLGRGPNAEIHRMDRTAASTAEPVELSRRREPVVAEPRAGIVAPLEPQIDTAHVETPLPELASPPVPPVIRTDFTGTWFYAQPKIPSASSSLYPPEYVEAVIVEADGVLHGRYRARYQVADRAISPEVVFRFQGKPDGHTAAILPWTGPAGATGELRLKLLSQNSMQLSWVASELGAQLGFLSGNAVLVRRLDP